MAIENEHINTLERKRFTLDDNGDIAVRTLVSNPISFNFGDLNFTGEYVPATTYNLGDSVSYIGSSYVAIQQTTGNLPTNETYWQLLAGGSEPGTVAWGSIVGDVTDQDFSGKMVLDVSSASTASFNIPEGVMPTTLVSGDVIHSTDGFFIYHGNDTKQIDFDSNTVGPTELVSIRDNGDGTINAGSIHCFLYSSSGWDGSYRQYQISAANSLSLTDQSINYLVVNYNSGSPVFQIVTSPATINNSNIALAATLSREGTVIHSIPVNWGLATAIRENNKSINISRFNRISGLALTESATNIINIATGVIYYGITVFSKTSATSASSGAAFYYHVAGVWTRSVVSTYNITQYDDGTNLQTLGSNRYAVNWVYRYVDGDLNQKIAYILGSGDYTLAEAKASTPPTPPTLISTTAVLVGRIIVSKGASTATQIDSAFSTTFSGTAVTSHNDLSSLQGGTASEYYHLTSSQYSNVAYINSANSFALVQNFNSGIVMPKTSGSGIKIDTNSPAFGWRDLLGAIHIRDTSNPVNPAFNVYKGSIRAHQFSVNDECYIEFHIPHDYEPSSNLYIHAHWSHIATNVTSGGVTWSFEVSASKGHNQQPFCANITTSIQQDASTTQYQHMIAEVQLSAAASTGALLANSTIEVDSLILVRCYLSGNTINGTPEPFLHFVDIHYQSTGIATKNKAPNFYT